MFTGKSSTKLEYEISDVVGDRFKLPDTIRRFHIYDRTHMKTPDGRVCIDTGFGAMVTDDTQKLFDKSTELFRGDCRIFNKRDTFRVAFHRHRQSERGFSQFPNARLVRGFDSPGCVGCGTPIAEFGFEVVKS
tara:strand:+ start:313 stop:711 length:399 start_codon:yes stop_codon:yes gene_type:complete